jgi:hypothetical protein
MIIFLAFLKSSLPAGRKGQNPAAAAQSRWEAWGGWGPASNPLQIQGDFMEPQFKLKNTYIDWSICRDAENLLEKKISTLKFAAESQNL